MEQEAGERRVTGWIAHEENRIEREEGDGVFRAIINIEEEKKTKAIVFFFFVDNKIEHRGVGVGTRGESGGICFFFHGGVSGCKTSVVVRSPRALIVILFFFFCLSFSFHLMIILLLFY